MKKLLQVCVLVGLTLSVWGALNVASAEAHHGGGGMGGGSSHPSSGMSHNSGMQHRGYINPWLLYPLPSQKRKTVNPIGPLGAFRR